MVEEDTETQSIEVTLIDSLTTDLRDLGSDTIELGLDSLLDPGLAKDIPVIGSLVKLFGVGTSMRDALFVQKLFRFLHQLKDVPEVARDRFVSKLNRKPKLKRRVGQNLLLALERHDDLRKSELLANVFQARLLEHVTPREFAAVASVIDRIMLPFLADYEQLYWLSNRAVDGFDERCAQLITCDLMRNGAQPGRGLGRHGWNAAAAHFFELAVGRNMRRLREGFLATVPGMRTRSAINSERHAAEQITLEETLRFLAAQPDSELLELKLGGTQINQANNRWVILRLDDGMFQRLTELPVPKDT